MQDAGYVGRVLGGGLGHFWLEVDSWSLCIAR